MAAGIPLAPTHPADPYAPAIQAVRRMSPLLADVPFKVYHAPGPYQSETYQPWGPDNPDPGNLTIQLRAAQPKTPQELQELIATEAMHYLGTLKPGGQPVNPAWWNLKQQFRGAMSDRDKELAQQHYQDEVREAQARGDKPRSFDDFMNQSYLDMFMRGYMFPKSQGQEWVARQGHWPPAQTKILDQMQRLFTTGR